MPHPLLYLAASAILVAVPNAAFAQDRLMPDDIGGTCELSLRGQSNVDWEGPYGRGYDVFDEVAAYEPIQMAVEHSGAACRYFLTLTPVAEGGRPVLTSGGNQLVYDVLQDTSGPSLVSASFEGTPSTRIAGTFAPGADVRTAILSFVIAPRQFVESGMYGGQFVVRLYREDGISRVLQDELPVTLLASVPARLRIESPNFTGGAATTSINLGELSDGAREQVAFDVRSNSRVNIGIQSTNGGALAHRQAKQTIPYRVLGAGQVIDVSGMGGTLQIGTSQNGQRFPLEIEVPAGHYPAGEYSDVLTVTFSAQ